MLKANKSNLIIASSKADVQISGGVLSITGLDPIKLADVVSIEHYISRVEVSQVWTIGTTAPTVTASTKYTIALKSPGVNQGFTNRFKNYSYTSPAVLSGTAATDRNVMYVALAALINADAANNVAAVANVGGSGVSMTITDDAGYYPARPSERGGASSVNLEGGFTAAMLVQTTLPIYSFGQGTRLAQNAPVYGPITGNLDAGEVDGLSGFVAGQTYDGFYINYTKPANHEAVSGLEARKSLRALVYVDNGRGVATTNLTGFVAFRRAIQKAMYMPYMNDPSSIIEFFEERPNYFPAIGYGSPVGTGGVTNNLQTFESTLEYTMVGTSVVLAPAWTTAGLNLDLTHTDALGVEVSGQIEAIGAREYTVGKTAFSIKTRVVWADITAGFFLLGFRKKEAYTADWNDYNDLAAIGSLAASPALIQTHGILTNAATLSTTTGISVVNAIAADLEVQVDINGNVKALLNSVEYPIYSAGTTPLVLTAGEIFIPFARAVNVGGGTPAITITKLLSVAGIVTK